MITKLAIRDLLQHIIEHKEHKYMEANQHEYMDTKKKLQRVAISDIVTDDPVSPRPEGGWGWVIVAAALTCNILVEGTVCIIGAAMQPQWEIYFHSSTGATAWAVSILSGVYCIVGPFSGSLVAVFGCRKVVIVGSLVAFSGFMLSAFAINLIYLYFTLGIIGGVGFGLMYLPIIVIVSEYFDKRRALATGIVSCGSGIGTFVWTPFIKFLLSHFTWDQTLMIMAAIILNGVVCGALFRHPPELSTDSSIDDTLPLDSDVSKSEANISELANVPFFSKLQKRPSVLKNRPFLSTLENWSNKEELFEGVMTPDMQPTIDSDEPLIPPEFPSKVHVNSLRSSLTQLKKQRGVLHHFNKPMERKDVFFSASRAALERLDHMRYHERRRTLLERNTSVSMPALFIEQPPISQFPDTERDRESLYDKLKNALFKMSDISLLLSPTFLTLCISSFLTMTAFYVPYIYLPTQAVFVGHSEQEADFLICLLGIVNIFARLICGWLSDHPLIDALIVRNLFITLGGVTTALVPFMQPYWMFCLYCVFFGFTTASFGGLNSVICVELIGIDKLTSAYGVLMTFMGLATLVGSPITGTLGDLTGTYDVSFYLMGVLLIVAGLMCVPLKWISSWEARRAEKKGGDECNSHFPGKGVTGSFKDEWNTINECKPKNTEVQDNVLDFLAEEDSNEENTNDSLEA